MQQLPPELPRSSPVALASMALIIVSVYDSRTSSLLPKGHLMESTPGIHPAQPFGVTALGAHKTKKLDSYNRALGLAATSHELRN